MGLLAKIFGAVSWKERQGIHLDTTGPHWELSGTTDFPELLEALVEFLPDGCVLYFEGGGPQGELAQFLREHAIPERAHVAMGTIWPRPAVYHIPATVDTMTRLAELWRRHSYAWPELAVHFHVYQYQAVLLEWYDVFADPMRLSGVFAESQVRHFAERLGMRLKRA